MRNYTETTYRHCSRWTTAGANDFTAEHRTQSRYRSSYYRCSCHYYWYNHSLYTDAKKSQRVCINTRGV